MQTDGTDATQAPGDEAAQQVDRPEIRDFDEPVVYRRHSSVSTQIIFSGLGGLVAIVIALFGILVVIGGGLSQITLHTCGTLPAIFGVFVLMRALSLGKTPASVTVDNEGVTVVRGSSTLIPWQQIAAARVVPDGSPMSNGKTIKLYDANGKTLAAIGDGVEMHDSLGKLLEEQVAARGKPEVAEEVTKKSSRKFGVLSAGFGLVLLAVAASLVYDAINTRREARLFETAAVDAQALVTDLVVAPNGFTKRVYFEVTGENGEVAEHNVEATEAYWSTLAVGQTIPVRTVPGEPHIARMAEGEVAAEDPFGNPVMQIVVLVAGGGLGLLFVLAGVAGILGYDIENIGQSK